MTYKSAENAIRAAAKRSLFASLNGKFSQFDAIKTPDGFMVVESGKYPAQFSILRQYSGGYSL